MPKMRKQAAMQALGRMRRLRELQHVPVPSFFEHSKLVTESETLRALEGSCGWDKRSDRPSTWTIVGDFVSTYRSRPNSR